MLTHEDTDKLVQYIADLTKNHIHKVNGPNNALDHAKKDIMFNQVLKNHFTALCRRYLPDSNNAYEEVYDIFMGKTTHMRFAAVFRWWKESNVKKYGKIAFHPGLKAHGAKTKKSMSKDKIQNLRIDPTKPLVNSILK